MLFIATTPFSFRLLKVLREIFQLGSVSHIWVSPGAWGYGRVLAMHLIRAAFLIAVLALAMGACFSFNLAAAAEAEALPGGWKHADIGAVEVKGSASIVQGVFNLKGTLDTWGTNDGFHFVWRPMRSEEHTPEL